MEGDPEDGVGLFRLKYRNSGCSRGELFALVMHSLAR